MFEWSLKQWVNFIGDISKFVLRRWYLLLLGAFFGAVAGYWSNRNLKPKYTATISFVLSTEQRTGGAGLAGLASQLGLDAGTSGAENVFSGENIIELFKSNKMVRKALLLEVDPATHQSLLNYIAFKNHSTKKKLLPFPSDPSQFTPAQQALFRQISDYVKKTFIVFKKDKKLVFYYISATTTDQKIAYYVAKCMLTQTAGFFIETKTSAAAKGLKLLQKEADSLSRVLGGTFRSTASLADRTYNINPSMMVQRSGAQYNQAKATAAAAAYSDIMRNLEMAKIAVQKETPLFSIIDEPDLPLPAQIMDVKKHVILLAIVGFILIAGAISIFRIYQILIKPMLFEDAK